MIPRASTYIGALIAIGAASPGCDIYNGDTTGESGMLGFYEPNEYPGDTEASSVGFERPLALGARADAWVIGPGLSSLSSATTDDAEIVSASLVVYPIVLRGVSEGTTTLHVTTGAAADTLPITVVRPDGARVWEWRPSAPLALGIPESAFGHAYALRPGASIIIAAEPRAGSTPLLGFDLFDWIIEPPLVSDDGGGGAAVNTRSFTALGSSGVAHVSTQLGGDAEIVTLAATDAITLKAYSVAAYPSAPTEITRIAPADVATFALVGEDAGGRLVRPSRADDAAFELTVVSGTVTILEATLGGRFVQMRACTGTGTVRIAYLDATLDLPIEVRAEAADSGCP